MPYPREAGKSAIQAATASEAPIHATAVRDALGRILASKTFSQSPRLRDFLRFVVEEALLNRGSQLKEFVIATAVWKKDDSFDPRTDPVVRTEARRLRYKLKDYYEHEGIGDAIQIDLPKGSYCPSFRRVGADIPTEAAPARPRWPAIVAISAVVLAVSGWWVYPSSGGRPVSIAVLPLENLSGDPQQEFFSDGLTDELITALAQLNSLRVISRTSVQRFKRTKQPVGEIGSMLGVDYLIEGTVQRSGNRVRITAQLISTGNERHLWADTFEKDNSDILSVENELARAIARQVNVRLTPAQQRRFRKSSPVSDEAYEAYLRGRDLWHQRTQDSLPQSILHLRHAVELEPQFARAWAGLADTYLVMEGFMLLPTPEALAKSRAAAEKALSLDPEMAEPHATLGGIAQESWRWDVAEQEFRKCIEKASAYSTGHYWYSHMLAAVGRFPEAIREAKLSVALDPLAPIPTANLGFILYLSRQYDEALRELLQSRKNFPQQTRIAIPIALTYIAQGRYGEARRVLETGASIMHRPLPVLSLLGYVHGKSGDRPNAQSLLAEIQRSSQVDPMLIMVVHMGMGNTEEAIDWLEKAYRNHSGTLLDTLKVDPIFDSLRSHPRFQEIVRNMRWPE